MVLRQKNKLISSFSYLFYVYLVLQKKKEQKWEFKNESFKTFSPLEGSTHFLMEGICIAANRCLSPSHPMFKLMAPHFLHIIAINKYECFKLFPWFKRSFSKTYFFYQSKFCFIHKLWKVNHTNESSTWSDSEINKSTLNNIYSSF